MLRPSDLRAIATQLGEMAMEADRQLVAGEANGDDETRVQTLGALSRELWKAQEAALRAVRALAQLGRVTT